MSGQTKVGGETLRGTMQAVNFAPKGEIDGIILEVEGDVVQVNVPPDKGGYVAGLVGQEVEVEIGPEPKVDDHPKGSHPVHKLVAFRGEHESAGAGRGDKPHHPEHGEPAEVTGKVARLNYAKHGEANGVVLESGDFVHMKPDGMKKSGLKVGHEVTAKGKGGKAQTGARAVDAETVNGVALHPKKSH